MARIIVTTGPVGGGGAVRDQRSVHDQTVLLDERVESAHLCEDLSARQLIERIAWAVSDADEAEDAP